MSKLKCPNCNGSARPVTQSNSYLNSDQFDAIRAGDYYCETCPEEAGTAKKSQSGYAYFWERDIAGAIEERLASDYFSKCRQMLVAHDKLLEAFGVAKRNDVEVKDLRDRNWSLYKDSAGTTYVRVSLQNSTDAGRVISKGVLRKGSLALVQAGFDIGSAYFLLSADKQL
jgi:hypothetical protein